MQQTAIAPTTAVPAVPATPAVSAQATTAPAAERISPLSQQEIASLRARREELSNQLTSASERRGELVQELKNTPVTAQAGVLDRIGVLDKRLVQLESDMAETGRQLTSASGLRATTSQQSTPFFMPPEIIGRTVSYVSVIAVVFLAVTFTRLLWRRKTPVAPPPVNQEMALRMERLEQAVDAIAIEVERVGESQRYQARILTEAQLMPALGAGQAPAEPIRIPQAEAVRVRSS